MGAGTFLQLGRSCSVSAGTDAGLASRFNWNGVGFGSGSTQHRRLTNGPSTGEALVLILLVLVRKPVSLAKSG